jgi:deoxyribose-phosphate aldolase
VTPIFNVLRLMFVTERPLAMSAKQDATRPQVQAPASRAKKDSYAQSVCILPCIVGMAQDLERSCCLA